MLWLRASSSTNQTPALWRVLLYSGPGLPSPAISLIVIIYNIINECSYYSAAGVSSAAGAASSSLVAFAALGALAETTARS